MKVQLISRTESNNTPGLVQLQFADVTSAITSPPTPMMQGIQLGGFYDPTFAASLTVGATYTLTLTAA